MERSTISRWNVPLIFHARTFLLPALPQQDMTPSQPGNKPIFLLVPPYHPSFRPPSSHRENTACHAVPLCVVSERGRGSSTPRSKLLPCRHANARKPGTWTRKPAKTRQQPPSCPPPATAILPASSPCPLIARCWPFKVQHSISFIPAPKPAEWGSCESHMTHSAFCNVAIKKEFPAAAIALQPCRQPAPPLVRFASVGNATLQ